MSTHRQLVRVNPKTPIEKRWILRKRKNRIHIYLNDTELEKLTQKHKDADLSREEFCRRVLSGVEVKQGPSLEVAMLLKELNRIGTNINQIAVKANTVGFIDVNKLDAEINQLDIIERTIIESFAKGE